MNKEGTASATVTTSYPSHPKGPFSEPVFEIKTTALFSGVVKVAISFDGSKMTEDQKKNLKVYRNDLKPESKWDELTTTIDTTNNIAYGETDHFSVFGVH